METVRKTGKFKFTEKKQSVKGFVSLAFDLAAVVLFVGALAKSAAAGGQADLYVGSQGVLALILGVVGLALGISGYRGTNVFLLVPKAGIIAGLAISAAGVLLYVAGLCL